MTSQPVPKVGAIEIAPLVDELAAGDRLRNVRDSVSANTWKAYQRDLADYQQWLHDRRRASWASPATIVAYLEFLEEKGAKYSTIARRVAAMHKLVEAEAHLTAGAVFDDGIYVMDPTKDLRVTTALKAIRRRIRNEKSERSKPQAAAAIDGSKLLQILLTLDPGSPSGIRDKALLLIGWYGALRRSEIAGMRREHLTIDDHGVAIELTVSKGDQDDSVWVPIPRQPGREWDPVGALETWTQVIDDTGVDNLAISAENGHAETAIWLAVRSGGHIQAKPIGDNSVNALVRRKAKIAGLKAPGGQNFSAHSLRAGFVTEAKSRGLDDSDIMRHTRHKSLQMMLHYNQGTWWNNNAAGSITL